MSLFLATSCSSETTPPHQTGEYVAVYFIDGHGLIPEYARLPEGDPVEGLMTLLERGPKEVGRSGLVPPGAFRSTFEREGREELGVELSDGFWALPPGERFGAVAQIVFTLATLEEGKTLLLLDSTVPGELLDGSFEPLEQPLSRLDFAELEPWVQVVQPVAGATVGDQLPVDIRLREGRALVEATQGGRLIDRAGIRGRRPVLLHLGDADPGTISLTITVAALDGSSHSTTLPLRYAG